ncbi:protein-lysine methyltransferase METTL21C-like [Pelobates fuscus]|uniref:protein-lysine methyltransferase METTL21C-like n=1 Tax=Pelobates fuscus TaxID=191477 RepID=UPI002FE4A83F
MTFNRKQASKCTSLVTPVGVRFSTPPCIITPPPSTTHSLLNHLLGGSLQPSVDVDPSGISPASAFQSTQPLPAHRGQPPTTEHKRGVRAWSVSDPCWLPDSHPVLRDLAMDAECLECMPCVQPELPAAEEESSGEGDDDIIGTEEGRQQQDVPSSELSEAPQLGGHQEDILCDYKSSVKPNKAWAPTIYTCFAKEQFWFAGHQITIQESIEGYGGVIWPGATALCQFLEGNQDEFNLRHKKVLEIGSGTGLVSIVACLLGSHVIATDLPDILGNLRFNLSRNTNGKRLYDPEVRELVWGQDLESRFSLSTCVYDYILAADVVYYHTYLEELLHTMKYFCQPGSTLLWSNKFRFNTDYEFLSTFNTTFNVELLQEFSDLGVKIFKAKCKEN